MFFLSDGMNDLLCLEDSFGNLASFFSVFHEEKTQKQIGRHVVCKCKEDEFEGTPILDLWERFRLSLGHEFIGKKVRPSKDSVLGLWTSEASCSEKDSTFWISALKKAVLTICW